jgi:cardiolipin synthase A/B
VLRPYLLDLPWALAVALVLLDAYTVFRAVTRTRSVEASLAWVFAILALPLLGALAYLALAEPRVVGTARRRAASRALERGSVADRLRGGPQVEGPPGSLLRLAAAVTGLWPTRGNRVELLADDAGAFRRLEEAVRGARRSVWAEYYIIRNDATGKAFLDLLAARARDGLDVRLLYDALGSMRADADRLRAVQAAGGRVEPFLPLNPFRRRWSVHLRNHRKLVLVDGELGFTGGMNVGDEYSGRARSQGLEHFRDSHLSLAGPAVRELAQIFAEDWRFATGEALAVPSTPIPHVEGGATVAVIPSGPGEEANATGLTHFTAITRSRRRCWLTTPYFVPDAETLQALRSAALRGVDVRLLLPARSDVPLVTSAARSFLPALLRAGVRVFEYQASMLHAKSLLVDGSLSLVGSANVDFRSFRLNFELGALVVSPAFARRLADRFEADLLRSRELQPWDVDRGGWGRLGSAVARLLAPLL